MAMCRTGGEASERHYTPRQLADRWSLSTDTIRRMFENEPGVLKFGSNGRRGKRRKMTLRIPESVAERVHSERSR